MSSAQPIKRNTGHDHVHFDTAALLSNSYISSSPIAQQILAADLAGCLDDSCEEDACSDEDDFLDHEPLNLDRRTSHDVRRTSFDVRRTSLEAPVLGPCPSAVTYGSLRPSVAAEVLANPLVNSRDLTLPRHAERSLLRDNHFLPPKHDRPEHEGFWRAIYRSLFSTKVQAPKEQGMRPRAASKAQEVTPLLHGDFQHTHQQTIEEEDELFPAAVAAHAISTTWQREALTLARYSRSLILTFLLHYSVQITSVFTVGRIGRLELGAVSLAGMTANITCYAIFQGLSTCLDTLCAQAYGSGHKHLVGLQFQRMTLFLLLVFMLPISVLWWNSAGILGHIVPDQRTAALAGSYLRILILGIPAVAVLETAKRFVQAQGLFHATTFVLLIGAPMNVLANWLLVWRWGYGFQGAATAVVFTQNLLPLLLFLYVRFGQGMDCWNGFTRRAFNNWGPMVKLALPGMVMVEAQFFAFEILTLLTSQFGSEYLAAQSILVTSTSTLFNVTFPLSIAASTRVANLIGANLSSAARTSAKVALCAAILVGIFNMILLSTTRFQLPWLFTRDDEVAAIVSKALPICAVMQVADSLAATSHGLLRGIGRQGIGSYTNLASYYLIALPISLATGFALEWRLEGLWFGVTIGLVTVSIIELTYLYLANWEDAVGEAELRLRSDEASHGGNK